MGSPEIVLLTPHESPLLDAPVVAPATSPLAAPGDVAARLADLRARGLTPAEALTRLLALDLGLDAGDTAHRRGVTTRAVARALASARAKLDAREPEGA